VNVSRWGIANPAAAILIFVVLCLAGIYGLRQLPIATLPDFSLPEITVTVTLPGATPGQLETEVTRKVEDAVASLADIDRLTSTISEGASKTRILFVFGRDMDRRQVAAPVETGEIDSIQAIELATFARLAGDE